MGEEATKLNTTMVKVKKEKKEKNWLAANMAGMFDRKPKTKPKKEKNVELVGKNEVKIKQTTDKPQKDNIEHIEKKEEIKVKDTSDKAVIPVEKAWLDKWKFDDAEKRYYEKETLNKKEKAAVGNKSTKKTGWPPTWQVCLIGNPKPNLKKKKIS